MKNNKIPMEWPPIVRGASVPLVMKLRDALLTLMAWIILLYFMRNFWIVAYEYTIDLLLHLDTSQLPSFESIWSKIAPFLTVASLLVLWIIALGSLRRRAIRSTGLIHGKTSLRRVQQQFPFKKIDTEVLAKRFGVEQDQLEKWQLMRAVDVRIDDASGKKEIIERVNH